jgi:hypothetical protein
VAGEALLLLLGASARRLGADLLRLDAFLLLLDALLLALQTRGGSGRAGRNDDKGAEKDGKPHSHQPPHPEDLLFGILVLHRTGPDET